MSHLGELLEGKERESLQGGILPQKTLACAQYGRAIWGKRMYLGKFVLWKKLSVYCFRSQEKIPHGKKKKKDTHSLLRGHHSPIAFSSHSIGQLAIWGRGDY